MLQTKKATDVEVYCQQIIVKKLELITVPNFPFCKWFSNAFLEPGVSTRDLWLLCCNMSVIVQK